MSSIDNAQSASGLFAGQVGAWATKRRLAAQPHAVLVASVEDGAAEIERLRKALEYYANPEKWGQLPLINSAPCNDVLQIREGHGYDVARAALEATK